MLHQSLDELRLKADIVPLQAERKALTRAERRERWALLLDRHDAPLVPFLRIETYSKVARGALRVDQGPVALAYDDAVLRADGLAGDTFGDACNYFELSQGLAHRLLCDCHYRGTMTGPKVAARLRAAENGIFRHVLNWVFRQ
ncbi:hypothetical protein C5L14_25260 [Labrys okinawensis]|uniref:Uncharacterized protein n=1 Tax=Labrys okinawensis TaxID=346911 RepID=A0A2S9Q666_9HYPH|nr:hypothetical protein [Labrys okinawensis]PRH84841.1 hypothetical protein C5L14_25260 [Labrys okinawensis]